jgi:hypothetical protein
MRAAKSVRRRAERDGPQLVGSKQGHTSRCISDGRGWMVWQALFIDLVPTFSPVTFVEPFDR